MPTFYTVLTDVGQAKLANAIALGQTIEITQLAVGDGNGSLPDPDTSRTALVNEVRRAAINRSEVDAENPSWVVVEQVIPPDVGGWTIREIGVFDVEGDLIGYGNYPETYKPVLSEGSSRTQTVRFVMEVSDTAAVTLKVDPSIVLATRGYADDSVEEHATKTAEVHGIPAGKSALHTGLKASTLESQQGAEGKYPDAAGVRSAIDAGMAYQNISVFEVPGTSNWPVPQELQDGRRKALVTVIGGGGSGRSISNLTSACGGGGAGGLAEGLVDLSGVTEVAVTTGAGGVGGTSSLGESGGSSSFGPFLSATGGAGGESKGGDSGSASGGDINYGLGSGQTGQNEGVGSGGGIGGGGSRVNGSDGGDGTAPGAGGAGARGDGVSPISGSGAGGIVIVRW